MPTIFDYEVAESREAHFLGCRQKLRAAGDVRHITELRLWINSVMAGRSAKQVVELARQQGFVAEVSK